MQCDRNAMAARIKYKIRKNGTDDNLFPPLWEPTNVQPPCAAMEAISLHAAHRIVAVMHSIASGEIRALIKDVASAARLLLGT